MKNMDIRQKYPDPKYLFLLLHGAIGDRCDVACRRCAQAGQAIVISVHITPTCNQFPPLIYLLLFTKKFAKQMLFNYASLGAHEEIKI
jgi:hypothetical protein